MSFLSSIDEKDGLAVSLKESSQLVEEAKGREVQMQNKLKALEQQVQVLAERDQEVSSVLTHTVAFLSNASGCLYLGIMKLKEKK